MPAEFLITCAKRLLQHGVIPGSSHPAPLTDYQTLHTNSGSFATFTAIRRALAG
jgi:hypothetical protein